jgi:hypothetical protein
VKGTTMPSPVPRPLSILPKATQLRHRPGLAAQGLDRQGRGIGHGGQGVRHAGACGTRGRPEAQNGGSLRLFSRSGDIASCNSFMPLMPSISEWCILMKSAKRPPSSPSMMVHSQGGRLRSSGVLCRRPTSSPSSRSPPGQGSAAWRTWYSRSISSSSIQTGSGFLLKAYLRRRFHGGGEFAVIAKPGHQLAHVILRRALGQAELQQAADMVGRGADSVNSQAESSGLRRTGVMAATLWEK